MMEPCGPTYDDVIGAGIQEWACCQMAKIDHGALLFLLGLTCNNGIPILYLYL